MSELNNAIKDVKECINSQDVVKEYFRLKKIIDNDCKLSSLLKKMNYEKSEICKNKNNIEIAKKHKELYIKYKDEFEASPIVENFLVVQEEVNLLLNEIKDILSK